MLVLIIIAIIITFYLFNLRWIELQKVERRRDREGFVYKKITDEEFLCYLHEVIVFGYDFYVKDDKIYIRYKDTFTLDNIDLLANLTSHAEILKAKSFSNKYKYYCADFSDFQNRSFSKPR